MPENVTHVKVKAGDFDLLHSDTGSLDGNVLKVPNPTWGKIEPHGAAKLVNTKCDVTYTIKNLRPRKTGATPVSTGHMDFRDESTTSTVKKTMTLSKVDHHPGAGKKGGNAELKG